MDTERIIVLNALTLLVRKNDPTVFDNVDVFEKNMIENGVPAGCSELNCLKQSLKFRIPWEVRKGGTLIDFAYAEGVAENFSKKSDLPKEMTLWAVEGWISSMGLKLNKPVPTNEITDLPTPQRVVSPQPEVSLKAKVETFSNPKGRLGIVFGEDSKGGIKVFSAWYGEADKSETSGLAAIPVKLKSEPVVLFKAAPKKSEKTVKKRVPVPKINLNKKDIEFNGGSNSAVAPSQSAKASNEVKPAGPCENNYKLTAVEVEAMEMLKKGSAFAYAVIKMLAPVAVAGSAFSCRVIGELYGRGRGVKQDFKAAKAWLEKSIEMGDIEALYIMGNLYQFGMGVTPDLKMAKKYYDIAAAKGHKNAAESLKLINGLVSY